MTNRARSLPATAAGRRDFLGRAVAIAGLAATGTGWAHDELGPLARPLPVPDLPVQLHDGRSARLPALLRGQLTAVQMMFTTCSSTCPIQGAVFATLQRSLQGPLAQAQLLSFSVDPLSDDVPALAAWRRRFGAEARWLAAAPPAAQADVMLDFVGGRTRASTAGERHTAQIYLFDTQARLAFRCAEFASAADIARAMTALAQRAA